MSKYGFGIDFVNANPDEDSIPRVEIPHDPTVAYFVESAEILGYDGFATANPVLIAAALELEGSVVEIGCGFASTPILSAICRSQGRVFVSFEQEDRWRAISRFFGVASRAIDHSDPEGVVDEICEVITADGLVFVDGGEPYDSRGAIVRLLARRPEISIVVAHDYDSENDTSRYVDAREAWEHWFVYDKVFPYSLVCCRDPHELSRIRSCVE